MWSPEYGASWSIVFVMFGAMVCFLIVFFWEPDKARKRNGMAHGMAHGMTDSMAKDHGALRGLQSWYKKDGFHGTAKDSAR